MRGLAPFVLIQCRFLNAKSRLPWQRKRESQTLTLLADALSVLDRLRRSAGPVLRKWKNDFRKAVGTATHRYAIPAQPQEMRPLTATYDALRTGDCGLSAGILPATAKIYNPILCSDFRDNRRMRRWFN
jgi:hypothetical protein